MNRQLFNYCERAADGSFWAEPLNAITNGAFIIAAIIAFIIAQRARRLDGAVIWLIALTAIVGTGSFLFHTFATVWAVIADSTPIMIFILSYFAIAMRYYGGYGWGKSLLLMLAFVVGMVGLSFLLRPLGDTVNGSQSYFPALFALVGVGLWLRTRQHPAGLWLIGVGAVFAASLTFRSIDFHLCEANPHGTHLFWHILNGVVLGSLIVALVRHGGPDTPRANGTSA